MPNNRENELQQVGVRIVPEQSLLSDTPVNNPKEAVRVIGEWLGTMDRELFCIVNLQADLRPINMNVISVGALSQSLAHPREVMKSAILSNAHSIMLIHNHPSGNLEPSKEDINLTDQLVQAGVLMGIPVMDHIITTRFHEYYSMNDKKMINIRPISYERDINNLSFGASMAAENTLSMEQSKDTPKKKTDLQDIMDSLEEGVTELFTSERYTEYLKTMAKFHNYSFNNTLLIAMQKPDATLVAGYNKWKSMGRQVTKDQKAIKIIAPAPIKKKVLKDKQGSDVGEQEKKEQEEVEITIPRFKITNVFDISQTEGEPLPTLGVDELEGNVDRYEIFMKAITKVSPVPIRFDEIDGGAHGFYHNVDKEIVIKKGMSELQTMKTAIHEVAHAKLHDRDIMQAQGVKKDSLTKEVEAESVAYAVCQSFELDTSDYSFAYIAGWSSGKDMKELRASMDVIRKTAGDFITDMSEQMKALSMEQERFVEHFFVAADVEHAGHMKVSLYDKLDNALNAYYSLSPHENRSMGVQNSKYLGNNVTLLECKGGVDQLSDNPKHTEWMDYPTYSSMMSHIQESLPQDTLEKLANDLDAFSYDYDTYGYQDAIDDREAAVKEIRDNLEEGNIKYLKEWLKDVVSSADEVGEETAERAQGLLGRMQYLMPHEFQASAENIDQDYLRYFVAECMEFPVLGEYHENLTFEEAVKAYEKIPAERLHGIKGIGIQLHHNGEVEESDILSGTKVEREWIDMFPHLKDHPLVQKAMTNVETFVGKLEAKERKSIEAMADQPIQLKQTTKPKRRGGQEL